jgi:hypothetical protein
VLAFARAKPGYGLPMSVMTDAQGPVKLVSLPSGPFVPGLARLGVARMSWGPRLFKETMALFEERVASLRG